MKKHLPILFLIFSLSASAQEYNYVHYDTKDGLAGSTVYRMCQDKKGYMWFASDNGVSMFDGKRFKNFTAEDGLTDNDVLDITTDSKGRVWMMPFNKSVCYYYEGNIYSSKNDSSLRNAHFSSFVAMVGENERGEVYFATTEGLFLYKNSGELREIANYKQLALQYSLSEADFMPVNLPEQYPHTLVLYNRHHVFVEKDEKVIYLKEVKSEPTPYSRNNHFMIGEDLEMIYPKVGFLWANTTISDIGDSQWLFNTLNGSWLVYKDGHSDPLPYLPGKRISNSMRDNEGNLWFSTIGEGIYRLTSRSMKTFSNNFEAFCLEKVHDRIYAGLANGDLLTFHNFVLEKQDAFKPVTEKVLSQRLYTLTSDTLGNLFLGFDLYLVRRNNGRLLASKPIRPIKSIDVVDEHSIVISTNLYTARVRNDDFSVLDVLYEDRGTKVIYDNGFYYIGTLNGLVIVDPAKKATKEGENNPLLTKRIVDMCKMPDGGIWIATNDNGLLLYKDHKVDTVINTRNGLSSNICKSLFLKDHYLWVGTNKGLSKIDVTTKKVIMKYSISDGLASDVINDVYADNNAIWLCSPAGVTYFNEKDISDSSICVLDLVALHVADDTVSRGNDLELSYKNNHISFDYTAISFKSAGEIIYKYKLNGLDDDWKETRLTTLSYPSLPPGDYDFQLYAVNKYGKPSNIITIPFSIATPFWKTFWFWTMLVLFIVGCLWYILYRRYKRLQKRMKEKNELIKRMMELEQASLRAQMNPHFIFNCLNSIQHFILQGDIKQTNRYIAQFGSLIRQTLDNSARANISIADEINYLTSYLELEQMRFSSQFHYEICLDKNIRSDYMHIPSMLLQPFVENGIRHGIRYKQEGVGLVKVMICDKGDFFQISIEDNGVGREVAARYKSQQHIEYQSKGITLTQKRLDIINAVNTEKIERTIIDLKDKNGAGIGTKVVLLFPRSVIEKLN